MVEESVTSAGAPEGQREPEQVRATSPLPSEAEPLETADTPDDVLELPHGRGLDVRETYGITAANNTRLVVLAGSQESGKTTLITSIYHLFQRGGFAGYIFAGSKTLVGFEQRCHPARTSSDNTAPQTVRTSRSVSDSILHLVLRDSKCVKAKQDILVTDLSGEDYESVIANVDLARKEFAIVRRADSFVLLIDGDRISQKKSRHSTKQQSIMLLRTFRDAGLLGRDLKVDVLLSKYDIVKPRCVNEPEALRFIESLKSEIRQEFGGLFNHLSIYEVAARPQVEDDAMSLGYGVERLLPSWVETDSTKENTDSGSYNKDGEDEFNSFAYRVLGHSHERTNQSK